MSTRRDFLKNMSMAAAAGLLVGKAGSASAANSVSEMAPAPTASKIIGLQTYSLGKEFSGDIAAVLKKVKAIGYTDLELAGYNNGKIGQTDLMEFKKMAEAAGLKIVSSHVSYVNPAAKNFFDNVYTKDMIPGALEFWKKTADDHAKLGCTMLVQPMMPTIKSHEDAAVVCDVFNQVGDVVKAAGIPMGFGYHNHNMEFQRVVKPEDAEKAKSGNPFMKVGDQIYDLLLAGTDPSKLFFEMDVYWTVMGQNDPVEYMKKNPTRIKALHIKDRSVLGQSGMMNFEQIFKQMYANGIKHYFVELENMPDGRTQFVGCEESAKYLLKAPFVK